MGICIAKPLGENVMHNRGRTHTDAPTTSRTGGVSSALIHYMNTLPRLFFYMRDESKQEDGSDMGVHFLCSMSTSRQKNRRSGGTENHTDSQIHLNFRAVETANRMFFEKSLDITDLENIKNAIDKKGVISWNQFFKALEETSNRRAVKFEFIPSVSDDEPNKVKLRVDLDFKTHGVHTLNITLREVREENDKAISDAFIKPLYQFYSMHSERKSQDQKLIELEKELQSLKDRARQLQTGSKISSAQKDSTPRHELSHPRETMTRKKSMVFKGEEIDLMNFAGDHVLTFLKEIKKRMVQIGALSDNDLESFNQVLNTISFDSLFKARLDEVGIRKELQADEQILKWLKRKFAVKDEEQRNMTSLEDENRNANSEIFKERLGTTDSSKTEKTRLAILEMFDRLDEWNFDVFTLDELTEGHTLFITGYTIFLRYDLINKFNIDEDVLINFLLEIESGYHSNPYHNAMHAADVTQVLHFIITKGGLMRYMTDEDVFATIFAALVHDLDHPGLNNAFQTSAQSYLATLYNDQSVLENHHCSQAFELCRDPKYNIFKNVSFEQYRDIRTTVIDLVLATDMSLHGAVFGKFKNLIEAGSDFTSKEDVRLALQISIKMADVSNPTRPRTLYLKWTERIIDEFYRQGDKEREMQMPISPMMDRNKGAVGKGQIAFMNYIVHPMFESFCNLLPKMNFTLDLMNENKQYWIDQE